MERRTYKIFTDSRKNMMTVPAWTDFKAGEEVLISQAGDFLLVVRVKKNDISFREKGEALRGLIDAFMGHYGLQDLTSPLLERVVKSFNILQDTPKKTTKKKVGKKTSSKKTTKKKDENGEKLE